MDLIPISEFTEATLTGNGVFDVLMRANKAHLEEQYNKDRIKGPEYSTVYLQSLQTVMTVALQFVLAREKAALEGQLLTKQILLTQSQIDKTTSEKILVDKQAINVNATLDNIQKEGCKLAAEFDVLMGNVTKVTAETNLLTQKKLTEQAQVSGTGVDVDSVIGRQKALYAAQTAGFSRTAEQAVAKLLTDSWAVRRTTDSGTVADGTNMLNDAAIGRAINKMLSGVGA